MRRRAAEQGPPRATIDPHPNNARALRAYEKAGFRPIGRRHSQYGDVVLMAVDATEDDENLGD